MSLISSRFDLFLQVHLIISKMFDQKFSFFLLQYLKIPDFFAKLGGITFQYTEPSLDNFYKGI